MRLKKGHLNYFFHPYELSICGFSNTGKTTLTANLIQIFSQNHKVGYLKNYAHNFQVDRPGKDTAVAREAGASDTLINDKSRHVYISDTQLDQVDTSQLMRDNDLLFIEGLKYSQIPKILLLGSDATKERTLIEIKEKKITDIVAVVLQSDQEVNPLPEYPCFSRDNIKDLSLFIQEYFFELHPKKLYGLVLTGGKSQRMNKDKGGIRYFKKDQIGHSVDLLASHCDEVFVSCREEQSTHDFVKDHKQVHDTFPSVGPSSGILSAMNMHPGAAWVVLACDLPYLTKQTITHLIQKRNPFKNATCYLNPTRGWPEPLCTIYEPKAYNKIIQYFAMGKPCPRKVLFNSEIRALELQDKIALDNVNTPQEYIKAQDYFQSNGAPYES